MKKALALILALALSLSLFGCSPAEAPEDWYVPGWEPEFPL